MFRKVLVGLLAGASLATCANAASISYDFYGTNRQGGSVQQFDPLLGILLGYRIEWSSDVARTFQNPYLAPQSYSGTYSGSLGYILGSADFTGDIDVAAVNFSGVYNCKAEPLCQVGASLSGTSLGGPDARLIGTGMLSASPFGELRVASAGREDSNGYYTDVRGTLTYFFGSAAPEPASWAMMLVGFGAIGLAMRSRRHARVTFA